MENRKEPRPIGEQMRIVLGAYNAVIDESNKLSDRLARLERRVTRRAVRARAELTNAPLSARERAARLALLDSILAGAAKYRRAQARLKMLQEYETWLRQELVRLRGPRGVEEREEIEDAAA